MSTTSPRLNSPSWLRSYFSMMVAAIAFAFALFPESDASASTAATKAARFDMALGVGFSSEGDTRSEGGARGGQTAGFAAVRHSRAARVRALARLRVRWWEGGAAARGAWQPRPSALRESASRAALMRGYGRRPAAARGSG